MNFGRFGLDQALGLCIAHTLRFDGHVFRKGRVLNAEDLSILRRSNISTVVGAFVSDDELDENIAAEVACSLLSNQNLVQQPSAQGRCNLRASKAGVLIVNTDAVNQLNCIDASLTLATLPAFTSVRAGQVVATIKTIPFAVSKSTLNAWKEVATAYEALGLEPFRNKSVGLLITTSETSSEKLLEVTVAVTRARLKALGSELIWEMSCSHDEYSVEQAIGKLYVEGADLILISGASVTKDLSDIVPTALVSVGGEVVHFGMPVEPGNMLLYGRIGTVPVINMPGCARSRRHNGFDWVLQRLLADLPLSSLDIMNMGVGGLLSSSAEESVAKNSEFGEQSRPLAARPARIGALILAAGQSSRMGFNKLLCQVDGNLMVRRPVAAALESQCVLTMVVTGHQSDDVEQVLQDQPVSFVFNSNYRGGLSTSLRCGIRALPQDLDGVIVLLADMPYIKREHLDKLIGSFDPTAPAIVVPVHNGRRGNPVLWPRSYFSEIHKIQGDKGARDLIELHESNSILVDIDDNAIFADFDTQDDLSGVRFE